MRADVRDAGDFSSPQGLRCAPDSRVRALGAKAELLVDMGHPKLLNQITGENQQQRPIDAERLKE